MRKSNRVIAVGAALALCAGSAIAADQLVTGKKLLLKNVSSGNKVVHLSKDTSIDIGATGSAGDPTCAGSGGGGGSLKIVGSGGSGTATINLPCGGWTTNGTNTLYKYKDTTQATCTIVLVKDGTLAKAVCKGAQVAIDLQEDGDTAPVGVVTTLNQNSYCTEFGGTVKKDGSDGKTFLHKDATAPGACASPSGAFLELAAY